MRPIVTPAQMRELDKRTIEDLQLPGIVLMELAARGVMLDIETLLRGRFDDIQVLVFCGPGNNGGDGFAVARRLLNAGASVKVMLCTPRQRVKGDALINLKVYENLGGEIVEITQSDQLLNLPVADLIVDALLGTGLQGAAEGLIAEAIEAINRHDAAVVAVDIPSGVNGATGIAEGPAVQATATSTFGEIKVGHLLPPGLNLAGSISRVDIQIPPKFVAELDVGLYLVEPEDVFSMLPVRARDSHKGDTGKVLLIAGSLGMTGAAELAARACLRAGAGLVKVAIPRSAQAILAGRSAEIMTIPVAETKNGSIAPDAETTVAEAREWADVEVIGPGLSLNPETIAWCASHVQQLPLPTVIDADGLNALAQSKEGLANLYPNVILTPHIGEFARLCGTPVEEITKDRVEYVRNFAREWNVTLLLKGVPSLVGVPEGPVMAVLTGNPGMATAGMGDVLTGTVAGLLAQGVAPQEAALAGVTIHGLAGNLASDELGAHGIVAGDVVERLPLAQDILAGRAEYPQRHQGETCECDGDCDCKDECDCDKDR